jgi:energy-coupling factor transporter ATP-binding protein EcfA2
MNVYQDIVSWSKEQPKFIQEATKRLLAKTTLDVTDIRQLRDILEKEVSTPDANISLESVTEADIPQQQNNDINTVKILEIKNPNNICNLYSQTTLSFKKNGITLVYGDNGTGKSSFARILKKFCWSRQKNVSLKKNIYGDKTKNQSVTIEYDINNQKMVFNWSDTNNIEDSNLNSIFLFDTDVLQNYLRNELSVDCKPIGINILEDLRALCSNLDDYYNEQIEKISKDKPLNDKFSSKESEIAKWYNSGLIYNKEEINDKLVFSEEKKAEKDKLFEQLNETQLGNRIKELTSKKDRYEKLKEEISKQKYYLSTLATNKIIELKNKYFQYYDSYYILKSEMEGKDPLPGVGSISWKLLWESAKTFVLEDVHPDEKNFPMVNGEKYCPLCQQSLNEKAEDRLKRFNKFVNDRTSKNLKEHIEEIQKTINLIDVDKPLNENTVNELVKENNSFETVLSELQKQYEQQRTAFITYLNSNDKIECDKLVKEFVKDDSVFIIDKLTIIIEKIGSEINENKDALGKQFEIRKLYDDIEDLEILCNEKIEIEKYYNSLQEIEKINSYKKYLPKNTISKKIGSLLQEEAIKTFNCTFKTILTALSPEIAQKLDIEKTRTKDTTTYQKCEIIGHSEENISDIFSEGEQKIIALANFLTECKEYSSNGTIIFDDPVNSLDHLYRDKIANILVELSKTRQIIILTHDFYFTRLMYDTSTKKFENSDNICLLSLICNQGYAGIFSDEIPYLLQNVQQRVDNIKKELNSINSLPISNISLKNSMIDSLRKKMRELLEKTVEDVLTGKTISRFSKNISCKKGNLSTFICVDKNDIDFILNLFSTYSETEHDGTPHVVLADEIQIKSDLGNYIAWKQAFDTRAKQYKKDNGYDDKRSQNG